MKNLDESFDAELSNRLRDYSEEPRLQLWLNIMSATAAQKKPDVSRKRTRMAWILLLGLLVGVGIYYVEVPGKKSDTASSISTAVQAQEEDNTAISESKARALEPFERSVNDETTTSVASKQSANIPTKTSIYTTEAGEQLFESQIVSQIDINRHSDDDVVGPVEGEEKATHTREQQVNLVPNEGKDDGKTVVKDDGKTVIKENDGKRHKFSIYFTIMPTFGYQRINSNSSDDIIVESIDKISAFSTDRLGVRAELGVEDPLTRRIKVFGGLVYFQRKQTINYTEKQVAHTSVSEGPNGEIIVEPVYEYVDKSFEYELKNLGVQLGVSYELSRKKLLQTIGTGFEFHVALNKLEDEYKAEFTNNPSAYVFYNFYYRLQYPTESRLKAVFQPTLNYSFYINQDLHAPFYVKPYGLGLNLGFTYNF